MKTLWKFNNSSIDFVMACICIFFHSVTYCSTDLCTSVIANYRNVSQFFTNKASYYEKDTLYDLYILQSWRDSFPSI